MMAKGDSAVKPSRVGKTKKVNRPIVLLAQREEREAQKQALTLKVQWAFEQPEFRKPVRQKDSVQSSFT